LCSKPEYGFFDAPALTKHERAAAVTGFLFFNVLFVSASSDREIGFGEFPPPSHAVICDSWLVFYREPAGPISPMITVKRILRREPGVAESVEFGDCV